LPQRGTIKYMTDGEIRLNRWKRLVNSKFTVWIVALLAVVMLCISATIAFGFGAFGDTKPDPLEHLPAITDNSPATLKVISTDDADVANMNATTPSTEAAAALQTQDITSAPQSTVNQQQAAVGASLNAGQVNLQAPVVPGVNALNLDKLNLGL
jgi:hypothetical protein